MENVTDNQVLALAFSVWAFVVAYGVRVLHTLRADVRSMTGELHLYIVDTESRLSVLEDRQGIVNNRKRKDRSES